MTTHPSKGDEGSFDCELVAAWFQDAAAADQFSESAVEAVAQHVDGCSACRALAERYETSAEPAAVCPAHPPQ
jgi:hypothetical protein